MRNEEDIVRASARPGIPIILASASPRRVELLKELHWPFQVVPSHAPEIEDSNLTARETAQMNAYRKARLIANRFPDAMVIGADTVVALGAELFGKPADLTQAGAMLERLQGNTHEVVTGVCLMNARSHTRRLFYECTRVTFRALTRSQIDDYLAAINPFDKAGAYAIQDCGDQIIEGIEGSYTNVIGLPVERLKSELNSSFSRASGIG